MLVPVSIKIDDNTHRIARETQIKRLRGGFSEYVELLIIDDLKKKGIDPFKSEDNK